MADTDQEVKFCSNCKKDISANNFMMHEAHCRRHIALCTLCQEPIPKGELDQHFQDEHATVPCTKCRQNVEKRSLEKHEENDCPQRPQQCHYCELEVPKSELASHLDYCGSRTEQCMKCFQFIMLKDQLRHDETDCKPRRSPTVNGTAANLLNNGNALDFTGFRDEVPYSRLTYNMGDRVEENLNPFMFDEMSRLLNNQEERSPFYSETPLDFYTNQTPQSNIHRRNEITRPKRNNVESDRRQQNLSPEETTSPSQTAEDYDYLLALHLAHDLDASEEIPDEDAVNSFVDLASPRSPQHYNPNRNTDTTGDVEREFWREAFSTDPINQFQPDVNLPPSHNTEPPDSFQPSSSINSDINSSRVISANQTPPDIPILDNLSYGAAQNWISAEEGMEREGTMLPCEFCGALLPMEYIVQHQGVCDADPAFHSEQSSPANQPKKKTSNVLSRDKKTNITASSSTSRPQRRQADPVVNVSNSRRTNLDDRTTQRLSKNVNSNNLSDSSIGANGVANIKAMLTKTNSRTDVKSTSGTSNLRHQLSQNSTNQRIAQRGQRSDDLLDSDSSLEEELGLGSRSSSNQASTKAFKQSDNRARQTASRQVRGLPRPSPVRHVSGRGLGDVSQGSGGVGQALSIRPLGESRGEGAAVSSSSRQPRRSGNQVFSGPKRTSKRQLPDRPL